MNQLNHAGSSASSSTRSPSPVKSLSPTYNSYSHFAKFNIPEVSDSYFVKPSHMCSTDYLAHHATKPDINSKSIALNDLEEPIKLTILSDIERDQHLNDFK